MAKVHSITALIVLIFTGGLGMLLSTEIPVLGATLINMFNYLGATVNLESLSHVAGVIGVLATIGAIFLTYRKNLLTTGFKNFQDMYRLEMNDFKTTVRDYINTNDQRHTRHLERIVEMHAETLSQITELKKNAEVMVETKRVTNAAKQEWKARVEKDLEKLSKQVSQLNNKFKV